MKQLLILLLPALLFAQSERNAVELRRANSLSYGEEDGQKVQKLDGNVEIAKDSLTIFCDNALYFQDQGRLIFRKNVQVMDGSRLLYANEVLYNDFSEEIEARGDVRIYQDTIVVYCDRAVYSERLQSGYLFDRVRIKYDPRNVTLKGSLGYFDHARKFAWVTRDPVLTRLDSTGRKNTEVIGDTVFYDDELKRAEARGKVSIGRDSLTALGQTLIFFPDSMYAELLGEPLALQGSDSIRGDTMRLYFQKDVLDRVEVHGHAEASSPADSLTLEPRQRLTGHDMALWISENQLKRARIDGTIIAELARIQDHLLCVGTA
ncbi:hypothetical protein IT157_02330, partial [bacterium]|nr:hypothetical protein [bacterium]